jgi:hypothetical protein
MTTGRTRAPYAAASGKQSDTFLVWMLVAGLSKTVDTPKEW